MKSSIALKIVSGPMQGQEYFFDEHDTFIFGRAPECHACIPHDDFVSRTHFLLEISPPHARIIDLGSLNGTYVNDIRLSGNDADDTPSQLDLPDSARIKVGQTTFEFSKSFPEISDPDAEIVCKVCGAPISGDASSAKSTSRLCANCLPTVVGSSLDDQDTSRPTGSVATRGPAETARPTLENIKILSKIGEGGMGAVYLAENEDDKTKVAVKVVTLPSTVDQKSRELFLREMKILESLDHPNIVRYLKEENRDNVFCFVMEYSDGGSLTDLMKRSGGRLSIPEATRIMCELLSGMAYAHEKGLVHRDIKPANVILHSGSDGLLHARICDFGLAKSFDRAGLSGLTTTNTFGGTLDFMPKEQLTDYKYVRPPSDVWSLGAVFYHMLTGALPRHAPNIRDPIRMVLESQIVPLDNRINSVDRELAAISKKSLEIEPDKRFQDAKDFLKALSSFSRRL